MRLSDTEITNQIAKIENLRVKQHDGLPLFIQSAEILINKKYDSYINIHSNNGKAMGFDLMVKHDVTLHKTDCPAGSGTLYFAKTPSGECSDYCESPLTAVFLGVIKANPK